MALRLCILILFALCAALPASAWSPLGHRIVGELAQRQLAPAAQAEVAKLLAGEKEATLAGVSAWADTLRNDDPDYFKRTSRWHYVNYESGPTCAYEAKRECPDGACAVGAIETQLAVLADRSQPLSVRRDALKFVVHLVGDVHQPMHNGNRGDQGGNRYQISLKTKLEPEAYALKNYVRGVMGTNLHAVWDYYVLGEAGLRTRPYADLLQRRGLVPHATPMDTPAQWSRESCLLNEAWGTYPTGHDLDRSYPDAMRPLAERRVQQAGYRLAMLLNQALGHTP